VSVARIVYGIERARYIGNMSEIMRGGKDNEYDN